MMDLAVFMNLKSQKCFKRLFAESKVAYDVEAKVAELENAMKTALDKVKLPIPIVISKRSLQEVVDMCFAEAISIVRGKE